MIRGLHLPPAAPDPEAVNNRAETRTPQLAALLSLGVISCLYVLRAVGVVSTSWAASLGHLLSDVLLTFPLAFAAVTVGQWLARRLGIAEGSASGLFARAALIAGIFALFLAAASGPHQVFGPRLRHNPHTCIPRPVALSRVRLGGRHRIDRAAGNPGGDPWLSCRLAADVPRFGGAVR